MTLIEIAKGHVIVGFDGKNVTVYGEGLLSGYGSPGFVVFSNTIYKWNAPQNSEKISAEEKNEILQFLLEEFARRLKWTHPSRQFLPEFKLWS